jgi:hypothetical protein
VIEIEEPPDIQACAEHSVPLAWLWSPRSGTWKAWEPVSEDPEQIRRHRCEFHGDPAPAWRHLEPQDPSTIHAGAALVRAELAKSQEQQREVEGE